jgi:RimJ/RimL family protein N-acetyltransferase
MTSENEEIVQVIDCSFSAATRLRTPDSHYLHRLLTRRGIQVPAAGLKLTTAHLHLSTLFVLNDEGRIISTREPRASPGPLLSLVRSATDCAWAVRVDVPKHLANEIDELAGEEPPIVNFRDAPVHAQHYESVLTRMQKPGAAFRQFAGPAFKFPDVLTMPKDVVVVEDERLLQHNFSGWVRGEIAGGCAPVIAIMKDGVPVSICFSARRSDTAAEAGLETAEAFRGNGFAPRVVAAWALATRESGRTPLYSTFWTNHASLAVASKLGLIAYASNWSLID